MTKILVVDNHDSFVYTLVGYLRQLGADVTMLEADELDESALPTIIDGFDGVMISPGPGTPEQAGASIAVVHACVASAKPLIGVCLGHQAIAVALGATVGQAAELKHGMASRITHDGTSVFAGLESPLTVGRYHSLAIDPQTLPADLTVTARTDHPADGSEIIMAIRHRHLPVHGVQFHPESVLSEHGYDMLATWLVEAGLTDAPVRAQGLSALG